jgi:hypothetical protein
VLKKTFLNPTSTNSYKFTYVFTETTAKFRALLFEKMLKHVEEYIEK